MANKFRNEMEIELAGQNYLLRATFNGLVTIEDKAGCGLYGLLAKIFKSTLGIKEVVAIIYGGLVGAGNHSLSIEQVFELCQKHGFVKLIKPCGDFLRIALEGDETVSAESTEKKIQA